MAAYPCAFSRCGLSPRNDVHTNKRRYGFHEYVAPPKKEYQPTLEERVESLERRVAALDGETV